MTKTSLKPRRNKELNLAAQKYLVRAARRHPNLSVHFSWQATDTRRQARDYARCAKSRRQVSTRLPRVKRFESFRSVSTMTDVGLPATSTAYRGPGQTGSPLRSQV